MGRHVTFHVHSTIPFIEAGTIVCVCVGYLYTLLYTTHTQFYTFLCVFYCPVYYGKIFTELLKVKKKEMKEIPTFPDLPKRLYVRAFGTYVRSNGEIERKKKN